MRNTSRCSELMSDSRMMADSASCCHSSKSSSGVMWREALCVLMQRGRATVPHRKIFAVSDDV